MKKRKFITNITVFMSLGEIRDFIVVSLLWRLISAGIFGTVFFFLPNSTSTKSIVKH